MALAQLLTKKRLILVGLNSGTSADGLDLAAIAVTFSGRKPEARFLSGKTVPYPPALSREIQPAIEGRLLTIDKLALLDRKLGLFFGTETARFCAALRRRHLAPHLVGSHGQTIRHLPGKLKIYGRNESATVQLGHPESIASLTGLPVVADFRQADIGFGGEGAPITVFPMHLLFSNRKENRLLVNIGGIANYFFFLAGSSADQAVARDCGPGNSLLDLAATRFIGKKYDRDGKMAAKGKISLRLLTLLLSDNYLKGKYGNSTGRERFGAAFLDKAIRYAKSLGLSRQDIMATLVELTAYVIAREVRTYLESYQIPRIYLFGGGLKNRFLVERLKSNLFTTEILSVKILGAEPDYLEAECYALMAALAIKEVAVGLPHITGARKKTIAGRIIRY
ncbi:MAG: anhydro-N-acetylmuramic acid kinase [Candidatus Zixiibacteriota bacterium]